MTFEAVIRTVRGDVPAADWGPTNLHCHLVLGGEGRSDPRYADHRLTSDQTLPEIEAFATAGGRALVDLTPRGNGRDPVAVRRMSEATGVHVVMGTGIYHEPFHPAELEGLDTEAICRMLVSDIVDGVNDSGIRAGIIGEQGTYQGPMTERERAVFRASAWAAIETGAAVSTHTYLGRNALEQIDVMVAEGLSPDRIVIGHLDDMPPELDLCLEIVARGAWAQFDTIGFEYYSETLGVQMATDRQRLAALRQLADEGIADRVILASDLCKTQHLTASGGPGLAWLVGGFTDLAESEGISAELLDRWLRSNPATVLTLDRARPR